LFEFDISQNLFLQSDYFSDTDQHYTGKDQYHKEDEGRKVLHEHDQNQRRYKQ